MSVPLGWGTPGFIVHVGPLVPAFRLTRCWRCNGPVVAETGALDSAIRLGPGADTGKACVCSGVVTCSREATLMPWGTVHCPHQASHIMPRRQQPCWGRGPGAVNLGRGSRRWRLGRTGSAPAWDVQEGRACRCPCCEDSYLSSSVHALDSAASVPSQGGWQGPPAWGHPGLHTRSPRPAPCPPAQEDPGQPVRGPASRSRRGGGASCTHLPESSQPDPESNNPSGGQSPAPLTPKPMLTSLPH